MIPTVEWKDGAVRLLDQSRLPGQVEYLECRDVEAVARAGAKRSLVEKPAALESTRSRITLKGRAPWRSPITAGESPSPAC